MEIRGQLFPKNGGNLQGIEKICWVDGYGRDIVVATPHLFMHSPILVLLGERIRHLEVEIAIC